MRLLRLLVLALPLTVALCPWATAARETPADEAIRTKTLLLGNGSEPQDLDPQVILGYNEYNIMIGLFEGLMVYDEASGRPIPGAAESYELSEDGLTYTFHLRPAGKWSDGEPVTAQDFVLALERLLTPKLGAEYAYMLHMVRGAEDFNAGRTTDFASVGIKAVDTLTLRFDLVRPTPYFLDLCAHQVTFPVPVRTILKYGPLDQRGTPWTSPGRIVGNGAFALTEWTPNVRVVLRKNPLYWGAASNKIESVVFFPNEDIATDERNFRAGQLHMTYDLLPNKIPTYRRSNPEQLRIDPLLENHFIRFNVTRAPFDNKKVRQALARAIDREALCSVVLYGSRLPGPSFTPAGIGGYTARATIPHDFNEARRLLAEAGYPGGKGLPAIEIQLNQDAINQRLYEAIQEMWRKELGVTVRLIRADFRVYLDAMRTLNYHASRSRWVADYGDPGNYLELMLGGGTNNWTGWANAEYDALVRQAGLTSQPAERMELLQKAEAILLDEAPVAPVFYGARTYLLDTRIKGWVPAILGVHRYQTLDLQP